MKLSLLLLLLLFSFFFLVFSVSALAPTIPSNEQTLTLPPIVSKETYPFERESALKAATPSAAIDVGRRGRTRDARLAPLEVLSLQPIASGLFVLRMHAGSVPRAQAMNVVLDTATDELLLFPGAVCEEEHVPYYYCFDVPYGPNTSFSWCDATNCPDETPYFYCKSALDSIQFSNKLKAERAGLCISKWGRAMFQYSEPVSGVLGLGFDRRNRNALLDTFPVSWPRIIGLDLSRSSPKVHLGGYDLSSALIPSPSNSSSSSSKATQVELVWSETHGETDVAHYHWFPIHSMTLCGIELLDSVSMAIISSSRTCLGLPSPLYDAIEALIRQPCPSSSKPHNEGEEEETCYNRDPKTLPRLRFRLSHDGPELIIPLAELLYRGGAFSTSPSPSPSPSVSASASSSSHRLPFCIERLDRRALTINQKPVIKFGTAVLSLWYTVLDMDAMRVGIANRVYEDGEEDGQVEEEVCAAKVECIGEQKYVERLNACEDPDCSRYFFHQLNHSTKKCQLGMNWWIGVVSTVLLLAALELLLNWRHNLLLYKALQRSKHQMPPKDEELTIPSSSPSTTTTTDE
ncbi:hypothetical protein QOT17_012785 [Balamuthia mandrillaris]